MIPLGRAAAAAATAITALRAARPDITGLTPAGAVRRSEPLVDRIDVIGAASEPVLALKSLRRLRGGVTLVAMRGNQLVLRAGDEDVHVQVVTPDAYPFGILHGTGPEAHLSRLRQLAADRGFTLTDASLDGPNGRPCACAAESAVYEAIGLQFIPPELRQGSEEIDAAAKGLLPRLIVRTDIRGDLHNHTDWTDGHDSLETVVRTACELGYEYVAITDHAQSFFVPSGLSGAGLLEQGEAVASLRREFSGITILHGAEVDILVDGALDVADDVLARLDIVLASLHESAGQSSDWLARRYLAAITHPLVHIVTHPTNRLIGSSEGYDLDFDVLFRAAAANGTVMEIDGAPVHLDMDGALARRAIAAGATVCVSSDSHRASQMGAHMDLGVATARRGWVEPRHVLNTWTIADLMAALARKRGGTAGE